MEVMPAGKFNQEFQRYTNDPDTMGVERGNILRITVTFTLPTYVK